MASDAIATFAVPFAPADEKGELAKLARAWRQGAKVIETSETKTSNHGGLAQLARALAWHARGHRFDSDILHKSNHSPSSGFFVYPDGHQFC